MVEPSRSAREKTWRAAIVEVLESSNQPLHYEEIAERILAAGFATAGKTPEKTVSKELTSHPNLFVRVADGMYELVAPLTFDAPATAEESRAISRQGFQPSYEIRRAIESHAMQQATAYFERFEWTVTDVSKTYPFDLLCVNSERERLSVEVKGTVTDGEQIILTRNEIAHARENYPAIALYILARVVIAQDKGVVRASEGSPFVFNPWDISDGRLIPVSYSFAPANLSRAHRAAMK